MSLCIIFRTMILDLHPTSTAISQYYTILDDIILYHSCQGSRTHHLCKAASARADLEELRRRARAAKARVALKA